MNDPNHDNDDVDSSDSDDAGPCIPRGAITHQQTKRRRLWEGEALEWERAKGHDVRGTTTTTKSYAAVDLNQFRNQEVGLGYQAKHVIRQKTHSDTMMEPSTRIVVDTTTKTKEEEETNRTQKQKKKREAKEEQDSPTVRLDRYLQCKGMRQFRKELESILSS